MRGGGREGVCEGRKECVRGGVSVEGRRECEGRKDSACVGGGNAHIVQMEEEGRMKSV